MSDKKNESTANSTSTCSEDVCSECKINDESKGSSNNHVLAPSKPFKVQRSFKIASSVASLMAVNPFEAWIAPIASETVTLYNENGENVRSVTLPFKVQALAVCDNKDLVLSNYDDKSIHKLTQDGEITRLVNTSPFSPNGIHIIRETHQFIVCLVGPGGGKLVRYSKNGSTRLQTVMKDKQRGHPLFKFPRRVVQNINGDLGVVDISLHSLTVVDNEGTTRWLFKGSEESRNLGQTFDPWDVCVDSDSNYLVSNTGNHAVDMLDEDGNYLRQILTEADGIKSPLGLGFDSRGIFWLGHAYGQVTLYMLKEGYLQQTK